METSGTSESTEYSHYVYMCTAQSIRYIDSTCNSTQSLKFNTLHCHGTIHNTMLLYLVLIQVYNVVMVSTQNVTRLQLLCIGMSCSSLYFVFPHWSVNSGATLTSRDPNRPTGIYPSTWLSAFYRRSAVDGQSKGFLMSACIGVHWTNISQHRHALWRVSLTEIPY